MMYDQAHEVVAHICHGIEAILLLFFLGCTYENTHEQQ